MWNRASPLFLLALLLSWLIITPALAETDVSGRLAGVYTPGNYSINGDIWILAGDSVILEPGVIFLFNGQYSFTNNGFLCAVGTEADSIEFVPKTGVTSWSGLKFSDSADDSSQLGYCLIKGSSDHGICMNAASPTITHCTISNNATNWHGGGIRCENGSTPIITNCVISQNQAGYYNTSDCCGGGISLDNSNATIQNCVVSDNVAHTSGGGISCWYSDAVILNCQILYNTLNAQLGGRGGGMHTWNSDITIEDCDISNNYLTGSAASGAGIYFNNNGSVPTTTVTIINSNICNNSNNSGRAGGIYNTQNSAMTINYCTISGNSSNYGGGLDCFGATTIINSTISGNSAFYSGGGISCMSDSSPFVLKNSIIEGNASGEGTLFFYYTDSISISYCDFSNNQGTIIAGQTIPQFGTISTVNANNDPCDVFNNIFMDPLFIDATTGDYHLMANSPCINAGDPNSPLDPDSTIADIGAFYFDLTNAVINPQTLIPGANLLLLNYPNPFNTATNLVFNLPADGSASLAIYNIAGGLIATLVDDAFLRAGEHEVRFECATLSSGIYFATLQQGENFETKKLLLIK